jgi:hypothetical protein
MSLEEITDRPGPVMTKLLVYPAANMEKAAATLTVREREEDPRKPLPPSSWDYVDSTHIRIKAAPGFDTGALYEFIYPATGAVVQGIAYPSVRDFMSFLRYAERDSTGQPNPVHPAAPFKAVLAIGVSQSGRLIKDFVYQDFNLDIDGRQVFDGIMTVVSGSGRMDNGEFAQPGRVSRQHEDHLYPDDSFPFTYATTTDPISGKTDGLLVKCVKSRSCPKIFHIDTDTEVWQRRVSLAFTDPAGKPVSIPDNVRMFILTGVPHNSNDLEEWTAGTADRGICRELRSPLHYRYYGRALFVALDQWVTEGVQPPASRYPNFKDRTLVTVAEAGKFWPSIPGVPFSPVINKLRPLDFSKHPPAPAGPEYPIFVGRPNGDGTPIGGVEAPEIAVPLGTYFGRNFRAEGYGEGDLCNLAGSYIPFAATKKERLARHDSRLSLEERYKDQQDFAAKRKQAAARLVQQRLILPEDADVYSKASLPLPATSSKAAAKP